MLKRTLAVAALTLLVVGPGSALAQSEARSEDPPNSWSVGFGSGFVADPEGYLMAFDLEHRFSNNFGAGTLLQLGLEKDDTLVGFHGYGRYIFQFESGEEGELSNVEPFLQAGLGITHLDRDGNGRHRGDNTSFSMIFGGGLDYHFTESFAVGSRMLVGVVPADVVGETAYFSWEIARVLFSF